MKTPMAGQTRRKDPRRDGHIRYIEIQESSLGLLSWCDEFLGEALDHQGGNVTNDLKDLLEDLRLALLPLEDAPRRRATKMSEEIR